MLQAIVPTRNDPCRFIESELRRDPRLRSDNTRRGYLADLRTFLAWLGGRFPTKLLLEEYAAEQQRAGRSPNSINRALAAVRWYARRAADHAAEQIGLSKEERDEWEAWASRVSSVSDVTGSRAPKGRHITPGELAALMGACANDPAPAGVRDAAVIALAWVTGARRSELAGLDRADIKATGNEEGEIVIRHGKGDKARTVYLNNGAFAALADWLAVRGDAPGPLFHAVNKAGVIQPGGMSDEALAQMLAKRAEQAGLSESITWHDFRRTFAGNLLDSGADLVTVQKLMGHSSPTTTANYDRRGEDTKRRAVRALHVPYARRGKDSPKGETMD